MNTVRRYVQQSITLLYGEQGKTIVDESTTIQPDPITQSAADMEEIVKQANLEWCILRGGLFYGPGTGRQDEWRQAVQAGKLQYPGFLYFPLRFCYNLRMARMIPAAERIVRARALIQKARDYPVPPGAGRFDFSYVAQVKDILRQARDLIKFIPNSPTATPEMKAEVKQILEEIAQAEKGILRG